ncbi:MULTISPECIES: rod shape-determining protein MreC [Enterococcus]|uniref:Cell shape-determining protein MreC n=1 Tax=Enterococcus alishanensis TaxID=1303817 RepID=A0ABS6TFQ3_9ENTE|nr:rod shape-determining protein MreC [Enterococcus alishanensis]
MKKFNPNKNIIIILIIIIVVIATVSLTAYSRSKSSKTNVLQSGVNDIVGAVDKVISAPGRWIVEGIDTVSNLTETYTENQRLKEKIDEYEELEQRNKNQEKEISQLQDELELNETLSDYDKVTANVITRSPNSWQDNLVVDKGTTDGIEKDMAVMSQAGLVGRVVEASANSSKVELLTTDSNDVNRFPVKISTDDGDSYGVLSGYRKKKQELIADDLTETSDIKKGDIVQTSGLGGNSPANLPIGEVTEVKTTGYGLAKEIYIKPYADMFDFSVVTIIQRSVDASE